MASRGHGVKLRRRQGVGVGRREAGDLGIAQAGCLRRAQGGNLGIGESTDLGGVEAGRVGDNRCSTTSRTADQRCSRAAGRQQPTKHHSVIAYAACRCGFRCGFRHSKNRLLCSSASGPGGIANCACGGLGVKQRFRCLPGIG